MDSIGFVSMIISFILTAVIYGLAPLIFYLKRRSPIRKRTLKAFHIIYTVIIALFFAVANSLNGLSVNFAPAAIWGTLFYHINKSKLSDKGLLILDQAFGEPDNNQSPDEEPAETTNNIEQYGEIPTSEKPYRTVKLPKRESEQPSTEPQRKIFVPEPKPRRKSKPSVSIILAILLLASIVGNVYQAHTANTLSSENAELSAELEKKDKSISQITVRADLYQNQYKKLSKEHQEDKQKLAFYDSNIRFVVDGSDYYHTYDCSIFQNEEYLWAAHNIEFCRWLDYSPCPLCKKGRLVKIEPSSFELAP